MPNTVDDSDDDAKVGTVGHLRALLARFNVPDAAALLFYDSHWGTDSPVQEITVSINANGTVRVVLA